MLSVAGLGLGLYNTGASTASSLYYTDVSQP